MDFFVTGNSSVKDGTNLKFIAPLDARSGNFSDKGQNLQRSYSIAENIFGLVGRDKINFVLIGLTPDAFFLDDKENLSQGVFEENFQALDEYIKICLENNAKPVAVIFPVAPAIRENYRQKFLNPLLNIFAELEKLHDFKAINLFDAAIGKNFFADEKHLTKDGAIIASTFLTLKLFAEEIISLEDFSSMSYEYFYNLSYMTDEKFFNDLMAEIYSYSAENLRRKDKLKVAFVTDHAATWCGDEIYNLFAENPRFETTVFLCCGYESTVEDTRHDFEQFKAAGLNVVGIFDLKEETPPQDIIFFLRPYHENFSKNFYPSALTPKTLLAYIPYTIQVIPALVAKFYDEPIVRLAWRYFFETEKSREYFDEESSMAVPRRFVSGCPKLDIFYKNPEKLNFAWKMTRPDAKKIIWAPHHSFDAGRDLRGKKGTFPYNYRFIYEFAKSHPETSWVVKPHPRLMIAAVSEKIFPSVAAYEDYLKKWDELPNATVYTGAYYHAIFATSDGMIHDSCSFIAEYQYTHKPMIYLLNNAKEIFLELGKKILGAAYIVDGKNLEQISDAIQKIFIDGDDPLFDARLKVFDAELNYFDKNGMTASEFIYKNVIQELT